MHLIGQRWEFRIGNSIVKVDNAFSWSLWGQERMLVNEEAVQKSGGRLRHSQTFKEPWLTMLGEGELRVRLLGKARLYCTATLDGEEVPAHEIFEARWRGPAHSWPDEAEWKPQEPGKGWAR